MPTFITLFPRYILKHKLSSLFWGYILFSVILSAVSPIDISLSCPINSFLGMRCYGCGLTTATIFLLKFDFVGAWQANPLVYFIDPLILFFMIRHYLKFMKAEGA